MTTTERDILAEIMAKVIPAVGADVMADVVPRNLRLKGAMWEKQYEHITEAHLMTASSVTVPMTVVNRWNLFAEPE